MNSAQDHRDPKAAIVRPELLSPAGCLTRLKYALAYGADAVYVGVPYFSLRARSHENEFTLDSLYTALEIAHSQGKKVYFTVNVLARNFKLEPFEKTLQQWKSWPIDGLIMADPGLIVMAREILPHVPIHLSVQANVMNWGSVKFWRDQGVTRVILSRELSLSEIQTIHEQVPDMELEAFVHGAICMAHSGRCLISYYKSYRDANQGICDNSCRYPYRVYGRRVLTGFEQDPDVQFVLEDPENPGVFFPISEDEHGTYFFNAKDLCALPFLDQIAQAGVISFKIEGRTKSVYYVAQVTRVYRQAIEDWMSHKPFNPALMEELYKLHNRGYHPGFYLKDPGHWGQNYQQGRSQCQQAQVCATWDDTHPGLMVARGRLKVNDWVEVLTPQGVWRDQVKSIYHPQTQQWRQEFHSGQGRFEVKLRYREVEPFTILIKTALPETDLTARV